MLIDVCAIKAYLLVGCKEVGQKGTMLSIYISYFYVKSLTWSHKK